MQIIGFDKNDLLWVKEHYEKLAEKYKHTPETYAGYQGRAAMIRDLLWNWDALYQAIVLKMEEQDETPASSP